MSFLESAPQIYPKTVLILEAPNCVLTSVIETIILCGRQGIPLRGHRDSGPLTFESEKNLEDNNNDGNLCALL